MVDGRTILNALLLIVLFIASIVAAAAAPSATVEIPGVVVDAVKINGNEIDNGGMIREKIERGEKVNIKVRISSQDWPQDVPACLDPNNNNEPIRDAEGNIVAPVNNVCANGDPGVAQVTQSAEDINNAAIVAWITGDEHHPLVEVSETFNLESNTRDTIEFDYTIPQNLDREEGDDYKLNLMVSARGLTVAQYAFDLKIGAQRHNIVIRDVVISPSRQVLAGRPFTVMARIQNLGDKDEETIKVVAKVPAFGIVSENAEFIDEIEGGSEDDAVTSEQIYLRIPADAKPGFYDVIVDVLYDEYTKKETAVAKIEVVNAGYQDPAAQNAPQPAEQQQPKSRTVITVGPEMQDVVKGQGGAIYPVTLTNEGATAKNYVVGIAGTEPFATVQMSPSNVVMLDAGASETVYVYLSAREDAQAGAHTFAVEVRSADKLLQQVSLTANVVEGAPAKNGLRRGLEVGLIVLIVVLIVLGLIIAFARSRKSDDEPLAGQAYY